MRWHYGLFRPLLTSDLFQKPRHVLARNLHHLNAFRIIFHLSRVSTDPHVPVIGTRKSDFHDKICHFLFYERHRDAKKYGNNNKLQYFPRLGIENAQFYTNMGNNSFVTNGDKNFLSSFLGNDGRERSTPKQQAPSDGHNRSSLSLHYSELLSRIKASLSAMQAFAYLSRENFKDQESGEQFCKIVNEDIEKTISLINCFDDYLSFSNPMIKSNTVNIVVQEVIKKHEREFKQREIKIIKKQFDRDLPEAILSDEQLRYLLNSVVECLLLSIPLQGSIGFLTRILNPEALDEEEKSRLQKDRTYLEILAVSASDADVTPGKENEVSSGIPAPAQQDGEIQLILKLVKGIVTKNRGVMRYRVYDDKPMTFISLILPAERRKVVRYRSSEERLHPTNGTEP